MKKKHFLIIFICSLILNFFNTCGIENTYVYFLEPKNVHIELGLDNLYEVWFTGNNQEKDIDDGSDLFIGYDIFYYFTSSSSADLAAEYNPMLGLPQFPNGYPTLLDFTDHKRFSVGNYSDLFMQQNFYQFVSFPVTIDMIDSILKSGKNDNVRFIFQLNNTYNPDKSNTSKKPYIHSGNDFIFIDGIYPKFTDYNGQIWSGQNNQLFQGFYDQNWYWSKNISYILHDKTSTPPQYTYKMYLYIVAKGFNSSSERTQDLIKSIKSNVIEIDLKVNESTDPTHNPP